MSTFLLEKIANRWSCRLAFSAAVILVVLLPYVGGLRVIRGDDTEVFIPALYFLRESIKTGESAFWNPYLAVGLPHFVAAGYPYNPINFLVLLFDPISAHYWAVFILLTLTLFFALSFLREIGLGSFGVLVGGLAYLMGNVYFAVNYQKNTVILTQVVLFWAIIKLARSDRFGIRTFYTLMGGLSIAYGWIANGYFSNLYLLISSAAFCFFLAWSGRRFRGGAALGLDDVKSRACRLLTGWFLIFLVGTILGSVQIIPAISLNRFSARSEGLDYRAAQGDTIGLSELLNFVRLLSPEDDADATLYFGLAPLMFLALSFLVRTPPARFFRWLFLVALSVSVIYSPLFWFMVKLPGFNLFRGASRVMFIGILGASVSAGFGVDYFVGLVKQMRYKVIKRWLFFIAIAISVMLTAAVVLVVIRGGNVSPLVVAVGLTGMAGGGIAIALRSDPFRRWAVPVIMVSVILDFVYVFYAYIWPSTLPRRVYEQKPSTADFLVKHSGRVFAFFPDDFDSDYYYAATGQPPPQDKLKQFEYDRETYFPNFSAIWRVENLEAYDPFVNVDMGRLMALLGAGRQLFSEGAAGEMKLDKLNLTIVERASIFGSRFNLASFLGIKYLLSGYNLDSVGLALPLRFQADLLPFQTSAGYPSLLVYENPAARPPAYFSAVDGFSSTNEAVFESFKDSAFEGVFVECQLCPSNKLSELDTTGDISITHRGSSSIKLEVFAPGDRFVVFSQNFLPGWKASVDGREVSPYKVNTVFMGVFVPPGRHEVNFEYHYSSFFSYASIKSVFASFW